jgi:quercetin dioxygenase-like cupin family protein
MPGRRIITGHDESGTSMVIRDDETPHRYKVPGADAEFFEIWNTDAAPSIISATDGDRAARPLTIPPAAGGSIIRIVDIHPGKAITGDEAKEAAASVFEAIGSAHASTWKPGARHPLMHRTETIDYGIVLQGEIYLILDRDETLARAGDIVVQRGTDHAWENRGSETCRIVFVLIDGTFDPSLAALFK